MIVTAALAWYDETPEDLDRFVRSLAGFCDRLIAVDGGYARYPGAKECGTLDEALAIEDALDDLGMTGHVIRPDRIWRGQVAKRSFVYDLATKGSDWIFTLDADHILHGPTEQFRDELAQCGHDAVEVPFYTTLNRALPLEQTASTDWHREYAGRMIHHRLLFRALPGMRVERYHWYISALKGGQRHWLTAVTDGTYPVAPANRIDSPFCVEHRCLFRRERNILANREFCNDRIGIVAETDQEDALEVA